jgi:carboxypeptidase Taq
MINGEVDYDTLDTLWADKYEEYLGIRPENPSEGILQDIHWSEGMFGYFPTYALGSAFGAQFYNAMKKQINIEEALSKNQFEIIRNWLKENIHTHGATLTADEILNKVTNESFNPQYYVDYLKEKYTKLYNI